MNETAKLGFALAITCAIAGGILAFANSKTAESVRQAELKNRLANLELVLPVGSDNPLKSAQTIDGVTFYISRDEQGKPIALAAEGSGNGFGGEIRLLVQLSAEGKVGTIVITEHHETPGLGTNVTDRKTTRSLWSLFCKDDDCDHPACHEQRKLPPNRYLDDYRGKSVDVLASEEFHIVKDAKLAGDKAVLAVTGSTVSSRAVADAVRNIANVFSANRTTLCASK